MSRLLAYIGNDPERVQCALHAGRNQLVATTVRADAWGVGFYQGGEVLLRRRPKPPDGPVDFYELAAEIRTDVLIGHVRAGTVGPPRNENTHPFRFRSWLFAHHGTVTAFDQVQAPLLAAIPDFLRRNIRGQTDSEHLFHLFLSFLHEAGKLDDPIVGPADAASALGSAISLVERLCREAGAGPPELQVAASNGRILLAARRGAPMHIYRVRGIRDCPVCREKSGEPEPEGRGTRIRPVDHDLLRAIVIVADATAPVGAPWEEIPERHVVTVSHELETIVRPLDAAA